MSIEAREALRRVDVFEREVLAAFESVEKRGKARTELAVNLGLLAVCLAAVLVEVLQSWIGVAVAFVAWAVLRRVVGDDGGEDDIEKIKKETLGAAGAIQKEAQAAVSQRPEVSASTSASSGIGASKTELDAEEEELEDAVFVEHPEGNAGVIRTKFNSTVDGWVIKNEKELKSVLALRERLLDLATDLTGRPLDLSDVCLIRFVRARKTLKESEKLFREAHEWRKRRNPHKVFEEFTPSPGLLRYIFGGWISLDKEGTPVFMDQPGLFDVPKLVKVVDEQEFLDLGVFRQENHTYKMKEAEKISGRPQYQVVIIVNAKGLGMKHLDSKGLKILKQMAQVDDDYYPERLKLALVINAPSIFSWVWNVIKYFFHPNTREKVVIVSGPGTKELLKQIDASMLPRFLGGDLEIDGDPECKQILPTGGPIPNDYDPSEDDCSDIPHRGVYIPKAPVFLPQDQSIFKTEEEEVQPANERSEESVGTSGTE